MERSALYSKARVRRRASASEYARVVCLVPSFAEPYEFDTHVFNVCVELSLISEEKSFVALRRNIVFATAAAVANFSRTDRDLCDG